MQTLTDFLMWCSILNGGLLVIWTVIFIITPGFIFQIQCTLFPFLSKDTFYLIVYTFLGLFKMLFLFFNLIPYLALLIIT